MMELIDVVDLLDIPIIPNRKGFCESNCPVNSKCYMCGSIGEEEYRKYLLQVGSERRRLYIFSASKLPRRQNCQWCNTKLRRYLSVNDHYKDHGKSVQCSLLLEVQRLLWSELVQVQRTGRWWAIGMTRGHCQHCIDPGLVKCCLTTTVKNKMRCIHAMCLDPMGFCPNNIPWWRFAFILA